MTDLELLKKAKDQLKEYPVECPESKKIQAQIKKLESKLAQ